MSRIKQNRLPSPLPLFSRKTFGSGLFLPLFACGFPPPPPRFWPQSKRRRERGGDRFRKKGDRKKENQPESKGGTRAKRRRRRKKGRRRHNLCFRRMRENGRRPGEEDEGKDSRREKSSLVPIWGFSSGEIRGRRGLIMKVEGGGGGGGGRMGRSDLHA